MWKFHLENLQLLKCDLLILSVGFREVNCLQHQARVLKIHRYINIYKLHYTEMCRSLHAHTRTCANKQHIMLSINRLHSVHKEAGHLIRHAHSHQQRVAANRMYHLLH